MGKTQTIGKLDESRNLNTSPWTVSGLQGDKFDYAFMIFCDSGGNTTNRNLRMRFNGDAGSNYDNNYMFGSGTTKGGVTSTGQGYCQIYRLGRNDSNRNGFCLFDIKGDSSQDRIITSLYSSGQPRIYQGFNRWNNNTDELESITFSADNSLTCKWNIVVFEIPKVGNNDNWELIGKLDWAASATEQSFTGLEGDLDEQYLLEWDSPTAYLSTQINNDGSSIYKVQQVYNNGSAFVASGGTLTSITHRQQGSLIINAKSGVDRTAFEMSGPNGSAKHHLAGYWYQNTATEVTSLYCEPSASVTAKAKLYRRKNPDSSIMDMFGLPFEKIKSIDVDSADYTTGESFTGLEGDKVLMYRLEFNGVQTSHIEMGTNGDFGASDYATQNLRGVGTAESAASDTSVDYIRLCRDSNDAPCHTVTYIYPQSGEYRPTLSYYMTDEDEITILAAWRLDTATEITSLLVRTTAAGQITGKFTLSAIYK